MNLRQEARQFVRVLQDALNQSITDGISLEYVGDDDGRLGYVGYRLTEVRTGRPIPVALRRRAPSCWLWLNQTVALTDDGYLKTLRARFAVFADEEAQERLLSYDFERNADNDYPTAHLQVDGRSQALDTIAERRGIKSELKALHLPVGGVRYRPSLEDLIEFLVIEGIADSRPNWRTALEEGRERFHRMQLGAAVRRDPGTAAAQLQTMGYEVEPPAEE